MEITEDSVIRPTSQHCETNSDVGMLPRPCSMPSFDRNTESARRRNLQTLPTKRSVKRGLDHKPWKSMSSSQGLFGTASPAFGTPSYPTHLDRIRASDIGFSTSDISSHSAQELNNNFLDSLIHEAKSGNYDVGKKDGDLSTSKKNLGQSLHSFSFAPGFSRGSFAPSPSPVLNSSLNASWQFFNFIGGADVGAVFPTTTRNPNKAIITIDGRTSKILVANEIAGKLFGYLNDELSGMKMSKLFTMRDGFKQDALLEQHIDTEGNIVMVSGKVVEAVDCDGNIIPVSLWMKRVHSDGDPRCVAVIEPVQRAVGSFLFNAEGTIVDCDAQFSLFHGFANPEEVVGESILNLIPAFMLPIPGHEIARSLKKQRATGKTRDNTRFPVSIQITEYDKEFHEVYLRRENPDDIQFSKFLYTGIVWVFSNISGLISVLPSGQIHSCNGNFSMMLFGFSEQELVGKDLTCLIPMFDDHVELAEDRSLRIPSISDDGEVQLDPKCDTAMSGKFGLATSSHSEGFSDDDSLLANCEYMEDLKGEVEISNSNSDQTTTSSLTIGSEGQENEKELDVNSLNESSASESSYLTPRPNNGQCSSTPDKKDSKLPVPTDHLDGREEISDEKKKENLKFDADNKDTYNHHIFEPSASKEQGVDLSIKTLGSGVEDSEVVSTGHCTKEGHCTSNGSCSFINSVCNKSCYNSKEDLSAEKEQSAEGLNAGSNCANSSKVPKNFDKDKSNDGRIDELDESRKLSAVDENIEQAKFRGSEKYTTTDTSNKDILERSRSQEKPTDTSISTSSSKETSPGNIFVDSKGYVHNESKGQTSAEEQSPVNLEYRGLPTSLKYERSKVNDVSSSIVSGSNTSNRGNEYVTEDGSVVLDKVHDPHYKEIANESSESERMKIEKDKVGWHPSQATSTPKQDRGESQIGRKIFEGNFCGQAKHKDGSLLPIVFQIKQITLDRGQEMFCIWVSRDLEEQGEGSRVASQMLFTGSFNSTLNTSHGRYFQDALRGAADLSRSLTEENYKGQYDERFLTLKSIGKGAFGFVKLAQRRSDGQEVVVKFIQKSKIVPSSWVEDAKLGKVPLEVFYLAKIDHPNVVKMFDIFENDDFFQLVMEKHGEGIDLFEFIDRQPALDEPICAYMFKQIVSAVSYLHNKNILHRDVKDENIIVDRHFVLKLIDFGSAVFMEPGKLFSTFCGTVEYCSPEVLLGNKYRGPELEVWSMGITLYTLVFGENPFFDVEETIKAELHPPFRVTSELMFLICWMLHSEPGLRATVKDIASYKWLNQKVDINLYDYDTIFAEEREDYYAGSEDRSASSDGYDEHYLHYDEECEEEQEYIAENERLEEEYMKYFQRQASIPEAYERQHGASF